MLKDDVRTRSYLRAIFNTRHLFGGKPVMDVGGGMGVLSIFGLRHHPPFTPHPLISPPRPLPKRPNMAQPLEFEPAIFRDIPSVLDERVMLIAAPWSP